MVAVGVTAYLFGGLREVRSLRLLAESDPLTGLLNRAGAQRAWVGLAPGEAVSLAVVDLNELKAVNDALGHAAGDRLLLSCARALLRACGERGWVARWGGDEFLVALPGMSEPEARARLSAAKATLTTMAGALPAWAVGVVSARGGHALHAALQAADARMYEEKAAQYRLVKFAGTRGRVAPPRRAPPPQS